MKKNSIVFLWLFVALNLVFCAFYSLVLRTGWLKGNLTVFDKHEVTEKSTVTKDTQYAVGNW